MSEDDGGGQTAGAGVGRVAKTRVRLTRPEKLEIMKLCVEHGHEYSLPGGRGAFWEKISRLGTARTGRDVRNPSQMVRKLLDMYVAGTPGSSWRTGELAACLEAWKNRVDQSGDGRGAPRAVKRRYADMADATHDDDEGDTEVDEVQAAPPQPLPEQSLPQQPMSQQPLAPPPPTDTPAPRPAEQQLDGGRQRAEVEATAAAAQSQESALQEWLTQAGGRDIAHALEETRERTQILKKVVDHLVAPQPQPQQLAQPQPGERLDVARIADCMERMDRAMTEIRDNTREILAVLATRLPGGTV